MWRRGFPGVNRLATSRSRAVGKAARRPSLHLLLKCAVLGVAMWCNLMPVRSGEPAPLDTHSFQKMADDAAFDAKNMVEALVNHNAPPMIVNDGDGRAVFAENYDWSEQDRIPKLIATLMDRAEEAWPELVHALDDKRYSVTFRIHDYPSNWSVGNVCKEIISDYLARGYYFHSVADDADGRQWDVAMMNPVPRKDLTKWCQARKDKKLYELQIETCQWAITKIPDFFPKASEDSRRKAIVAIKAEITLLDATRKPLRPECFYMWKGAMGEGGGPYHERRESKRGRS